MSVDHLILLLDPRLAHLPLESLDMFKHVQIGGIARDFSLQSVCNRLNPSMSLDESAIPGEGKLDRAAFIDWLQKVSLLTRLLCLC